MFWSKLSILVAMQICNRNTGNQIYNDDQQVAIRCPELIIIWVYQSQGLFDTQETILGRFLTMGLDTWLQIPVHLRAQCAGGVEAAVPRHGYTERC